MKRIFHILATLICIGACNHDGLDSNKNNDKLPDLSEYGEFQLVENAIFMTEKNTDMFSSVTNNQITIPLSVAEDSIPGMGSIIICPITEKTPSGLLVKVVSVSKAASEYVLAIEPAMLNEAFKELKVNSTFDITSFVDEITDGDGNTIEAELISSDIWNEFAKSPDDTTFTIPTKSSGARDFSLKLPIKNKWFKGYVFVDFSTTVEIDLSDGKLKKFNISLTKQTGVAGGIGLMTEGKFKAVLVEKSISFKPFLIPGTPVVICPKMYLEDTFEVKGKMDAKFNLRLLCENQTYNIGFNGENPSFDSKIGGTDSNHLKFEFLNADANMELAATCGCQFSLYHEDLLSFGVEASAKQGIHLQREISMENKGLLIDNPVIEVIPTLEASAYCETILFGLVGLGDDGRASYTWNFGLPSYEITPLPQFINVKKNRAGGTLTVSSEIEEFSLLKCTEEGFALFEIEEDTPIIHLKFDSGDATKAIVSDELTFVLPDPDKNYEARSYVVADGKHYYGPRSRKRLKSWKYVEDASDNSFAWIDNLHYDEFGRIKKVVRTSNSGYSYDRAVFSYMSDNLIKVTGDEMSCDYHYFEEGRLVRTEIYDDFFGISSYDYLYDSNGRLTEIRLNGDILYRFNWYSNNITSFLEYRNGSDSTLKNIIYGEIANTMDQDLISLWLMGGSDVFYACLYLTQGPYTEKLPMRYEWEQLVREYNNRGEMVNEFVFNASESLSYAFDDEGYVTKINSIWKGYDAGSYEESSNGVKCEYEIY